MGLLVLVGPAGTGGPAYPDEISEIAEIPLGSVKNALTRLRKQGVVENTGEKDGNALRVRLVSDTPAG